MADNEALEVLRNRQINTRLFMSKYLKIYNKDKDIVPLNLNIGQEKIYNAIKKMKDNNLPVRICLLKARQFGGTTLVGGVYTKQTIFKPRTTTVIVTHETQATTNVFNMYKRFIKHLPPELKPEEKANNAKAIIFDNASGTGLDSSISCLTASDEGLGASQTINYLHLSELGLWPGNIQIKYATIMQCVPSSLNSMVIIESTARGYNYFYDICKGARTNVDPITGVGANGFMFVFVGWYDGDDYHLPYSGFELTEEELELKKRYGVNNDQLEWRRQKIAQIGEALFKQEYPANPDEAFLTSGNTFFDNVAISHRLEDLNRNSPKYFDFEYKGGIGLELRVYDSKLIPKPNSNGCLAVFEEPNPTHPYVIGADTAGEGSDYFIAQVIDNITAKQVATMTCHYGERDFVNKLYLLGRYYNNALIAVETNFSTYPCAILERMEYPKLYIRETVDDYTHGVKKSYGYRTTTATRPYMLDNLKDIINNETHLINDKSTLLECVTFVKDENGKPCASNGNHDDTVMALAIAYVCRNQQDFAEIQGEVKEEISKLPEWAREDKPKKEKEGYMQW